MKRICLVAWSLLLVVGGTGFAAEPPHAPVVVEFFTSQGCSSCPPADELAGELAKRPDLVVLNYHVNYWDYIGWRDPFASDATTERQRAYAHAMRQRNVYTPEAVVGGMTHAVGSDIEAVRDAIAEVAQKQTPAPRIRTWLADSGTLRVKVGGSHFFGKAEVLFVRYDYRHETVVHAGENAGKRLVNFNVVRDIQKLGPWSGQSRTFDIAWTDMDRSGNVGCAVIVQRSRAGPVIGALNVDMAALAD